MRWERRRLDACALAEALSSRHDVGFPVNLQLIAAARRVRRIEFRPLIVDGALAVTTTGFEISVRCESFEAEELNELFHSSPDGGRLPPSKIHKMRFTIAHELAHTLFYDLRKQPPERKFPIETTKEATALERACQKAAAALLLPKRAVRKYFGRADFRDPETLATIAKRALVAKSVVIMRVPDIDASLQPQAILATVRSNKGKLEIENIWRHYSFSSRFPALQRMAVLDEALNGPVELSDLRIYGGYLDQVAFDVSFSRQTEQWTLSVEPKTTGAFIISLFRKQDFP
jgi:IrrE N-terminal-like domain